MQSAGHKLPALFAQHRPKLQQFALAVLDYDIRLALAVTVAVAPGSVVHAHLLDRGGLEPPTVPEAANAGEDYALGIVDADLGPPGDGGQEHADHKQANQDEWREEEPQEDRHADTHGAAIHQRR